MVGIAKDSGPIEAQEVSIGLAQPMVCSVDMGEDRVGR